MKSYLLLAAILLGGCAEKEEKEFAELRISDCTFTKTGRSHQALVRPHKPHYGTYTVHEVKIECTTWR